MKSTLKDVALAGWALLGGALLATVSLQAFALDATPRLQIQAAEHYRAAQSTKILGATLAGKRVVAVGDHGIVLLSDDDGRTFRQAQSVPVNSTLTSVVFADQHTGWAVGHWGAIIKSTDGGEHWRTQRTDLKVDQPLFAVYFRNASEGWAVGLWSLMLHTTDGGSTWSVVTLPKSGSKGLDRNLYSMFADRKGDLFIACEQGSVARSSDGGATWQFVDTGYGGSFWTGVALRDGTLLVGGLRGTIYRSTDGGDTWKPSTTTFKGSVTDMVETDNRHVVAVGLDGVSYVSADDGVSFTGRQRPDRTALTAVVYTPDGRTDLFSAVGPTHP